MKGTISSSEYNLLEQHNITRNVRERKGESIVKCNKTENRIISSSRLLYTIFCVKQTFALHCAIISCLQLNNYRVKCVVCTLATRQLDFLHTFCTTFDAPESDIIHMLFVCSSSISSLLCSECNANEKCNSRPELISFWWNSSRLSRKCCILYFMNMAGLGVTERHSNR